VAAGGGRERDIYPRAVLAHVGPLARLGVIDRDTVYRRTQELLAQVGLTDLPDTLVTDLGVGKQQLVEIAKALAKKVKLLILDEPTAALNEEDSENLLNLLLELKKQEEKARELFAFVRQEHPRTPWDKRAEYELERLGFGVEIFDYFYDPRYHRPDINIPNF
jgi:ATPase subunit of ABC transporter with duplicated ATPase domains